MENIKTIAVVGAGVLGSGIVRAVAPFFSTLVIEKNAEMADAAMRRIQRQMDRDIGRWRLTSSEKNAMLSRVSVSSSLEDAVKADIVIESIPEEFDLKVEVFQKLDAVCRPDVIFITTTASLSITKMASKISRSDLFIGMNFQMPVPRVPVVEVVTGYKTSDFTREKINNLAAMLKKKVISVVEYPGYVTTRVMLPFINEAMYVVMEGVASAEDVDMAIKLSYNLPMGPLALADSIGLDTILNWMEHLFHELGDLKYRPCPMLRKLVNANHLGVKTGEGVFTYASEE